MSNVRPPVITPALLSALVLGVEERWRIREAMRDRAQVRFVERATDLVNALREEPRTILGILTEPFDLDQRSLADTVAMVHRRLPTIPIIGYCRVGIEHSAGTRALAAAGAHELIFHGVDDTGVAFRSVLDSATQACAAEIVLAQLLPLVPESLHRFASFCVRYPHNAHTVNDVAAALGLNRKTFLNYSIRDRVLAPAEILAWCRICLAAHFLATSLKTVEAIAMQLDFPSDTALRNMIKRYTGLRAHAIRERGGLPCVLNQFTAAVARHREARPQVVGRT